MKKKIQTVLIYMKCQCNLNNKDKKSQFLIINKVRVL